MKCLSAGDDRVGKIVQKKELPPDGRCRLSGFVVVHEADGRVLLKNILTRQVYALTPAEWALVQTGDLSCPQVRELAQLRFLVEPEYDEAARYALTLAVLRTMENRKPGIVSYTILPTTGCNARCVYCYEEGWPVKVMSPETADAVADFICRTKREGMIKLHWFGGEPLCAPKTISRICRILQDRGVKYDSAIVTNATLLTPELVKEAVDLWHLSGAQVSMDGARQDYEARKRYLNPEQHNYEKAMEGVTLLLDAGIRVSIRCNFDGENLPRLQDFMEDCRDRFGERKNICVYVEQLRPVPDGEESWMMYQAGDDAELYEESLGLVAPDRAGDRRLTMSYCIADPYGSALVIDPLGGLHACEHKADDTPIGTVFDAELPSRAAEKASLKIAEECKSCPYLPECTPFRKSCPVVDEHCRRQMEMWTKRSLTHLLKWAATAESDGDEPGNGCK